jgi:GNAT superfamily N-acetyltransferase
MKRFFKESDQNVFFDLLPGDWKNEISPVWDQYSEKASIYLLEDKGEIRTGGIVFEVCPPDMSYNKKEAEKWLGKGYHYIGFVWVVEAFRNQQYGSKWLSELMVEHPKQKYWLTIEEEGLLSFYAKNKFRCVKTLQNGNNREWLLIYEPV